MPKTSTGRGTECTQVKGKVKAGSIDLYVPSRQMEAPGRSRGIDMPARKC